MLPDGYFLREEKLELTDARNQESQDAGFRVMRLNGLSPLGIETTIDWFRNQGQAAGFSIYSDGSASTVGAVAGAVEAFGPGWYRLSFDKEQSRTPLILSQIWFHQDLGGYTYVSGFISVDTNK